MGANRQQRFDIEILAYVVFTVFENLIRLLNLVRGKGEALWHNLEAPKQ